MHTPLNVLSLFSGIGGLELGLERAGLNTVGQVELDGWSRTILAHHWPDIPQHDDVRTAPQWWLSEERPHVDVIAGGFPCQDLSNAGRREGITGPKSGLWGAMAETIRRIRPRYVVVENVAALLIRGFDTVLADLHDLGFNAEWSVLSACAVGAPHTRERLFVVAYRDDARCGDGGVGGVGDGSADFGGREGDQVHLSAVADDCGGSFGSHWVVEPEMVRMADGVSRGLDRRRLFALGNAVVPQVGEVAGRLIMARETSMRARLCA